MVNTLTIGVVILLFIVFLLSFLGNLCYMEGMGIDGGEKHTQILQLLCGKVYIYKTKQIVKLHYRHHIRIVLQNGGEKNTHTVSCLL